ncbi:MAG: hypothetical protein OM95_12985 [Bdellovibrio sp. ArHS]|uniref:hypothetical protein n=1 Tax=Bdellovibrio sp. ArHS TaxID=1569284 RepID=UPI0005826C38|nr:hypothetical protein [Bdellovibrio sp. ArHS]KHD87726.1 MAG: hypothetical protein OM95_12985 [Bdellovibrio sp. ArHS]
MKSLKLIIINALTLIIGLGLMSGSVSQRNAEAARFETIPSLQVNRLGNLRGQYLTVLYAVGSRPFISTDSSQITISQVKESRTVYISADSMTLPSVQVEKEGFRPSYNIIVFVVSPQPNYSWVNADGSAPQGMSITSNRMSSLINAINKTDVDSFISSQGDSATLQVNLVK